MPFNIAFESKTFPFLNGIINYMNSFEIILKFLFFKNVTRQTSYSTLHVLGVSLEKKFKSF